MIKITEDVSELLQAVWQVLDDMGTSGICCCLYSKALLRKAYEPFAYYPETEETCLPDFTLSEAIRIIKDIENYE